MRFSDDDELGGSPFSDCRPRLLPVFSPIELALTLEDPVADFAKAVTRINDYK